MALGLVAALSACDRKPPHELSTTIPPELARGDYPPTGWAWGRLDAPGLPPLRYGVAPPARSARAEVLILPDAGEPAEAWFGTASALVRRGETVWMLDWAGQGGSARWKGASDRLYARSFGPDVAALKRLVDEVIRPQTRLPLVLVGEGLGAQLALRALAEGLPGVEGAVLNAPALSPHPLQLAKPFGELGADLAGRIGFGRPFVAGEHGWRPSAGAPDGVREAWMQANPRLRIGGASLAWAAAYNRSAAAARDPATLARVRVPVLIVAEPSDAPARAACLALPDCRFEPMAGGASHLSPPPARERWRAKLIGFVESRARGHAIGAP